MGIYNLGLSLQERSNLEEALKVAQAGYEEIAKETDPSMKIWGTSLQYVIGGCQLKLKQLNEGDKTMQQCYDQLMARAAADTTHAAIEQVGTMSTNIALHYLEEAMPWIERAEKALDLLAEHNKKSQQPSNEPVMRIKLQMIKAVIYAGNGLWAGLEYVGESIDFFKDRLLFLYTDGLNEAEDNEQKQFGEERLLDILRQTQFNTTKQVIETLTKEVERHRNGAEPNDDLTMLCLRFSC